MNATEEQKIQDAMRRQWCHCPEPVGDPRQGTCVLCGHQVPGTEMPHVADWKL